MKQILLTLAVTTLAAGTMFAQDTKVDPSTADVKVTITGNDTMQFDKREFTVTTGQTVALTFKNVGNLPVEAMGHNLVILAVGTDMAKFAMASMSGLAETPKRYTPKEKEWTDKILAMTKTLGPQQEETIVFTVPAPGTYDYVCTFPGHFAVMNGKMIVKDK